MSPELKLAAFMVCAWLALVACWLVELWRAHRIDQQMRRGMRAAHRRGWVREDIH